ncbi:hypothetical protein JCM15765_03920 [Paradesulfitobacterium aromaticivorans]
MYSTYSFEDVSVIISNPNFGQFIANGAGVGSISVNMTTDRTAHELAADGSVMVSKIKGRNGSLALSIQQTSSLQKWLLRLYNYLESAAASAWASTTIVVRSPMMQDLHIAMGVSFQKLPDRPYQAQGQNVNWTLMAADIQQYVA